MSASIAETIEHTLLSPAATPNDYLRLVREADSNRLRGVCVPSRWVRFCRPHLGEGQALVSVIGFPSGAVPAEVKAFEAQRAKMSGATELDMVLDLGAARSGRWTEVLRDVRGVVRVGLPTKVILETGMLPSSVWLEAARVAESAGAAFVKTCTGFGPGRARVEDVVALRQTVGSSVGVKASGGIRTRDEALGLLAAGASRIGTSRGPDLL